VRRSASFVPARTGAMRGNIKPAPIVTLVPEIAKSTGTPKRVQHMSAFSFFEVGFIRGN
jgi:hypothetical protein